ncbi:hypothetical protein LEN26_017950 [Aphanomyces euteiches]|nr:hypothetical protein LEN26_017950 [Aphanomyces euteiches]KAH9128199.1 hypothetical protein AeMF1_001602 [Aphanomyces euteiches]KAH9193680.1 hypothetical protein AeNC1_004348 [Aphanomyces euteiches]
MSQVSPTQLFEKTKLVSQQNLTYQHLQRPRLPVAWANRFVAFFDLLCWLLLVCLMVLQVINAFLTQSMIDTTLVYGARPSESSLELIPGNNDDPYIDRAMACVLVGRVYKSMTLDEALNGGATIRNFANITADSYTVMVRQDPHTTMRDTYAYYDPICSAIALTMNGIAHACADQGYLPVTDSLRINVGTDATRTTELTNALPILIMPYYDNGADARYGIPGYDGVFCSFMLYNQYLGPGSFYQVTVINRTDFDVKTRLWLNEPRGTWQNGWYTFPDGIKRYYSHMQSDLRPKDYPGGLGISSVVYDALTHKIADCETDPTRCESQLRFVWENVVVHNAIALWAECVCIQDKVRNGFVWYSVENQNVVTFRGGLSAVLANLSVFVVLFQWAIKLLAAWRGYLYGSADWHGCGIGILSCSDSFVWLPVLLAPGYKLIFLCFWASCIQFEGDLLVVCDAWFILYPALAQFVLLYFAVLNWLGKALRIRVSDRLFGPVLLALCLAHYLRDVTFINSGPSMGFSGRAQTLFFVASYREAYIYEVMFTKALIIGGNVKPILIAKLILLGLPLLELFVYSDRVGPKCKYQPPGGKPTQIESTLAIQANRCGGLGKSTMYTSTGLNGYEVLRLGYMLYGKNNILSFDNYMVAIACYPSYIINETFNQRILTLEIFSRPFAIKLMMFRWNNPRFALIWWFQVQSVDMD